MILLALIACGAFSATLAGGALALRFRDRLHLVLGFSAGAVAGVALFDLLPEAIELGTAYHDAATVALFVALGLFSYLLLDRAVLLHTHEDDEVRGSHSGSLGAALLSAHSFLDGIAIGVGFEASLAVGLIVAAAVLAHDFSDGINTVNLVLRSGGTRRIAFRWLLSDAIAPVAGVVSTFFFRVPGSFVGLALAIFVGMFLYLSAVDLIPESHHRHPHAATTLMTMLGAFLIWIVVQFAR